MRRHLAGSAHRRGPNPSSRPWSTRVGGDTAPAPVVSRGASPRSGALRPGLTVEDAATTIAALADYRLAMVLIDDHHLSLDAVEEWMADLTARAVLG